MSDKERAELKTIYANWPVERLTEAFANDRASYQPEAIEVMRQVLTERGVADADIERARAAARRSTPESRVGQALREKHPRIIGRRLVALLVDTVFSVGILLLADLVLGNDVYQSTLWMWLLLASAYYVVGEGKFGATPGKALVGLRVVKLDLSPCGYGSALVRFLLRIPECIVFPLIGLVVALSTKKRQRLGDLAAGTLVVRGEDLRPVSVPPVR